MMPAPWSFVENQQDLSLILTGFFENIAEAVSTELSHQCDRGLCEPLYTPSRHWWPGQACCATDNCWKVSISFYNRTQWVKILIALIWFAFSSGKLSSNLQDQHFSSWGRNHLSHSSWHWIVHAVLMSIGCWTSHQSTRPRTGRTCRDQLQRCPATRPTSNISGL